MTDLTTYNGDDLLKTFEELNINLGGLEPNVIRAWFDTDDQDVKNLLYFMCSGLTRENIVSAQEFAEFESLENPLYDADLEKACKKLEKENPGIFDLKLNSKQLEVLLAEEKLLEQEKQRLDDVLLIDEKLRQSLILKRSKTEKESEELDFKYQEILKSCETLSKLVDDKNEALHEKLSKDLIALANFQCDENSDFFNRKNLDDFNSSVEIEGVKDLVTKQNEELSSFFSISNINLNSTPNEEDLSENNLMVLQNQIYTSYMKFLETRMEEESLVAVNEYLENFFSRDLTNSSSPSDEVKQKELLFNKLEKKARIIAEEPVISIKINKMSKEVEKIEENLRCFNQISRQYAKLLSTISCALMLLLQEKKLIEETDGAVRHISKYILHNLEDTKDRIDTMLKTTNSFSEFSQRPLEMRNEILNIIVNIYNETVLREAYLAWNQLEKNLKQMEQTHFLKSNVFESFEKLHKTDLAKRFLTSGPTRKAIVLPNRVLKSVRSMRNNLDKQEAELKFFTLTLNQTTRKLQADEFLKNSRLVWIYFMVFPEKLNDFMEELEEELKKREVKAVRFKV